MAQTVKNLPAMQETQVHSLEKDMATHSSILAWRIPWTKETVQSMGCKELNTTERLIHTHTYVKLFCNIQKYLKEKYSCLRCKLNSLLFHGVLFLLERMLYRQLIFQSWLFGRHFLKMYKGSLTLQGSEMIQKMLRDEILLTVTLTVLFLSKLLCFSF